MKREVLSNGYVKMTSEKGIVDSFAELEAQT